uniref:Uncharacterized protein n=1 Tax=Anguilla anguilla TaxID=7936 RepID=A0A0E9ST63_ANGAN
MSLNNKCGQLNLALNCIRHFNKGLIWP